MGLRKKKREEKDSIQSLNVRHAKYSNAEVILSTHGIGWSERTLVRVEEVEDGQERRAIRYGAVAERGENDAVALHQGAEPFE